MSRERIKVRYIGTEKLLKDGVVLRQEHPRYFMNNSLHSNGYLKTGIQIINDTMLEWLEKLDSFHVYRIDNINYEYQIEADSEHRLGGFYMAKEWVEEIIDTPNSEITKELKNLMGAFK